MKRSDLNNFFADMGHKPDGCTLVRLEKEKGFTKENCVWEFNKGLAKRDIARSRKRRYMHEMD